MDDKELLDVLERAVLKDGWITIHRFEDPSKVIPGFSRGLGFCSEATDLRSLREALEHIAEAYPCPEELTKEDK